MRTFLLILTTIGFLVLVWYLRLYLKETISYKAARRAEIKRRLQVEHKQELALKALLDQPLEDNERFKLEVRAMRERHQRAIYYVIQDSYEQWH
jgi:hypothetical protein